MSKKIRTYDERTIYFFGVRVDNVTGERVLERLRKFLTSTDRSVPLKVFFTNVHSIYIARRDPEFHHELNHADIVLPDGSGLLLASRLFGVPVIENLNGTDFTPKLLQEAERSDWSLYLLGARETVVRKCYEQLTMQYPRLRIVGWHSGYFRPEEEDSIVQNINVKRPHIVLVAMGSPLQEKWIARNANGLRAGVCLAVGGLFDFLSNAVPRAPLWVRHFGLEWLYRLFQDPRAKWDRVVIEIPVFCTMILAGLLLPRRLKPITIRRTLLS